jgi:integrase
LLVPRLALTDRFVATCKAAPGQSQTDYFDERTPGLALRVSEQGHKAWCFVFTAPDNGKRARETFATYPAFGLAAARTRAREARGLVEAGEDPRVALNAQAAGAMTAAALVQSFLEKHARPNLRTAAEIERRLRKNAVPFIGNVRVADLHRRDINRVVDPIVRRGKLAEACRVFEDLRSIMRWAVARGDLDRNPMDGMKKPAAPRIRTRVLSDEEIRQLWTDLPKTLSKSKSCQRIIQLCLVTAQRVGEVAGLRRAELHLPKREWHLPASRTKNGHPHCVALSDLATRIITEALADAADSPFVFPSNGGALPAMAVARTIARAQGRFGIAQWSAHDLRRSAITNLARLGVPPIVLGHIANHRTTTKAGVTLGVYAHYDYALERRQALQAWADHLAKIVAAEPTYVGPAAAGAH